MLRQAGSMRKAWKPVDAVIGVHIVPGLLVRPVQLPDLPSGWDCGLTSKVHICKTAKNTKSKYYINLCNVYCRPAQRVADDDAAAGPQQAGCRKQRRSLIVHVAEDGVEEDCVCGALQCGQVHEIAAPGTHLHAETRMQCSVKFEASACRADRSTKPPREARTCTRVSLRLL